MTEENNKSGLVKGLGIGGLVLGIVALIISFVPCLGAYAIYPGILAIIMSIFGMVKASKQGLKKGLLIAALIISVIGSGIAAWQYSNLLAVESAAEDAMEQMEKELENN